MKKFGVQYVMLMLQGKFLWCESFLLLFVFFVLFLLLEYVDERCVKVFEEVIELNEGVEIGGEVGVVDGSKNFVQDFGEVYVFDYKEVLGDDVWWLGVCGFVEVDEFVIYCGWDEDVVCDLQDGWFFQCYVYSFEGLS